MLYLLSLPDVPSPRHVFGDVIPSLFKIASLDSRQRNNEVLAMVPNNLTLGLFALSRVQIISPCSENKEQLLLSRIEP